MFRSPSLGFLSKLEQLSCSYDLVRFRHLISAVYIDLIMNNDMKFLMKFNEKCIVLLK